MIEVNRDASISEVLEDLMRVAINAATRKGNIEQSAYIYEAGVLDHITVVVKENVEKTRVEEMKSSLERLLDAAIGVVVPYGNNPEDVCHRPEIWVTSDEHIDAYRKSIGL